MKSQTLLKAAVAGLLVFGGVALFGSTWVPPIYTVRTEIVLPASPEQSWEVLTDFSRYPQWNPYLQRVEGTLAPGELISFTLVDGNFSAPFDGTAQMAWVSEPEQFFWIGKAFIQGIYDTRHVFTLQPQEDGSTVLLHFEEFRGLLPALLPGREQRNTHTRRAFESMNRALQQRLASTREH
jgi:hypothetical protein